MKNRVISPIAVVLVSLACLNGTEVEVQDLQGNWIATHIAAVNAQDDTDVADLFALGWRGAMDIAASGAFTLALEDPNAGTQVRNGDMTTEDNNAVWIIGTDTINGEVFLEDDQVSFQMLSGARRDFDDDGVLDNAKINLVLNRVSS